VGESLQADVRCRHPEQRVSRMKGFRHWQWLDEVYVKLGGEMVFLWLAVDQEDEVLENYVTKSRDKGAALKSMK
jgi:putative transposase